MDKSGTPQSGMVCSHHLYSDEARTHVFGGRDGLVVTKAAFMATVQHDGWRFLCRRVEGSICTIQEASWNNQHRSRIPIYSGRLDRRGRETKHISLPRWERTLDRQCLHRETVEQSQMRKRSTVGSKRRVSIEAGNQELVRSRQQLEPHQALGYRTPAEVAVKDPGKMAAWRNQKIPLLRGGIPRRKEKNWFDLLSEDQMQSWLLGWVCFSCQW